MTGRFRVGYVSDMHLSPVWCVSDSLYAKEKYRERLFKTCTEHSVALGARVRT